MKVLFRMIALLIALGFTIGIHADDAPSKKVEKSSVDFDVEARVFAGDYMNYSNYRFNMPLAGAELDAQIRWRLSHEFDFKAKYKADITKSFTSYSTSGLYMDTYEQEADLDLFYRKNDFRLDVFFDYTWMIRPQWPDLYQTNVVGGALVFTPTDRYSYHKFNPGIKAKFDLNKEWELYAKAEYEAKISTIDPNWTPTHVTPRSYNAFGGELKAVYQPQKSFWTFSLSDEFERKEYTYLPARDAVTGTTNGGTNPLYAAWSNTTEAKVDFEIVSIGMTITPKYGFEIYTDEYQGYYSYTGHHIGLGIEQSLFNDKFEYDIGAKYSALAYGLNSKDPARLTDGNPLYKNYITADFEMMYHFSKSFSIFLEGNLFVKDSNYPTTLNSGATPEDDVLFSYDSFYVGSGVEYRL